MPRESTIAESAKQRSLRVPLDYYRRGDRLSRTKLALAALVSGGAAIYVAWLFAGFGSSRNHLSPGPLASAHAAWTNDCSACHQDFRPLRSDALDWRSLVTNTAAASDQACTKCHNEPAHHATAITAEVPGCATCHPEHRGSAAEIKRATDSHCLACHQNMASHHTGESALRPPTADVVAFATEQSGHAPLHPDFRSLANDPGNIKFDHWLHLQPGLAPSDAKHKLKEADLADPSTYQRYTNASGLVELDCVACHEPTSDGKHMRPIAYEQHCAACHPLAAAAAGSTPLTVPHGLSAQRLVEVIDGMLFATERQNQPERQPNANENEESPLIPGRTLGNNLAQKIERDVLGRRTTVLATVKAKCSQCHYDAEPDPAAQLEIAEILPASVPTTWFKHARFDHSAHRHVECRSCHEAAFAYLQRDMPQQAATDNQQVMIAGIENCAACHAPRRGSLGGARHDCAECHDYHGRDHLPDRRQTQTEHPLPDQGFHLTAFQASSPQSSFLGASSCASAGCHGATDAQASEWRTAFSTWAARDPHTRAYDVLWTVRAREMTSILENSSENLSESAHAAALEQRCTSCHATPGDDTHVLGVHCESCHGPSAGWVHDHHRRGFSRAASSGFRDTKDLNTRAATCMPCHVGSAASDGKSQVVDHDLIAAGHPRLAFEFRSYLESLPAHWDRSLDAKRRPGDHNFQLWRAGHFAQRAAHERISNHEKPPDFAQLDCFRCHHALAAGDWRQTIRGNSLPRSFLPVNALIEESEQINAPLIQRINIAQHYLETIAARPSWDGSIQAYLATEAVLADLPNTAQLVAARSKLNALGQYLSQDCFREVIGLERQPSIYDSPTQFEPDALATRIKPLLDALNEVKNASESAAP